MRCPACGATNPEEAAWCGQCYTTFGQPEPEPDPAPQQEEGSPAPAVDPTTASGFRKRGDVVEWQCLRCDAYTSVDELTCGVCGTPLAARYEMDTPEPEHNWSAALALSVVAPGAGHLAVSRYGAGAGRLLLFTVWLLGGVLLTATGGAGAWPAAAPLYLGAAAVWAGSLLDIYQLQHGNRELLAGRVLLWMVVGVIVLSMVGMFAAAGGALGTGG
jgi:hypothetical protein